MAGVLTLEDIANQGDALTTFLWLTVLFALSGALNELGFMGFAGQILAKRMGGISWPMTYVGLIGIYVAIHYMFVSQSSQVLALFGVFLDVGMRSGVPPQLMAFGLLFASSYFSVITPQGGSQNVISVGSGHLTQRELYRLGLLTTLYFLFVFFGNRNRVDFPRDHLFHKLYSSCSRMGDRLRDTPVLEFVGAFKDLANQSGFVSYCNT
jgi:divalent anion:Na+ symporter, DASS family